MRRSRLLALLLMLAPTALTACGSGSGDSADTLTIYSGREEDVVAPLFPKFEQATGIKVQVRYGKSAEFAAQIEEEGDNSPADVFFAQDAGALGSIAERLAPLPQTTLDRVPAKYRASDGTWVGVSGRVRVVAYNTTSQKPADLPNDVLSYSQPKYASKLGIAPTNASFQAFVTAMRLKYGDERTKTWLTDLKKNGVRTYDANRPIVEAIVAGDIQLGLVNHYYLAQVKAEQPDAPVANKFLTPGDPGTLVNVAGAGILASAEHPEAARKFVDYLLSEPGQRFYATEAEENEYPLVAGIPPAEGLPSIDSLAGESVPLNNLGAEEKATVEMIVEVGLTS